MDSSLFFHLLNGVLMVAIPLTLAIILTRRWKLGWRIILVGARPSFSRRLGISPLTR